MIRLLKQLFIERKLSGSEAYIAYHPELGVPIGIFNVKDEPTHQSRVNSIKKYGKKGNPLSYLIAKILGIGSPIPSYAITLKDASGADVRLEDLFKDAEFKTLLKSSGYVSSTDKGRTVDTSGVSGDVWETMQKMLQERTPRKTISLGDIQAVSKAITNLKSNYASLGGLTGVVTDSMDIILDMLALEDTMRIDISKTIGMSNARLFDTIDALTEASLETSKFNINANELAETFTKITKASGRQLYIPTEVTARATLLTKTLEGFDAGKFADAFDSIGMSLGDAIGGIDETDNSMQDVLNTGRNMGVVMETFLGSVADNLKLVNTYGFERGVEGLSAMVARAQTLGLDIGKVASLSEKFLDPEGAIDFAAKMQVIGGAAGDLTDPFKLMYMATNDLEGLGEAIAKTAAGAATFDKEKGKFVISPEQRRQMMAMKDELGMSYQELSDLAIKAAREAEVFNQIGDFSDMPKADKELLASMAEIGKGGEAKVRIPGIEEMVDVANVTDGQMELLRKEAMTDSDIYAQQLTEAERANQYLSAVEAGIRIMVKDMGGGDAMREMGLSQQLAGAMPKLTDEDLKVIRSGDMDKIQDMITLKGKNAKTETEAVFVKSLEDWFDKKATTGNDFILNDDGILNFNKDDLIIGGTKLDAALGRENSEGDIINRVNNMSNTQNTTMSGGKGMVELSGTLKIEGNGETADIDVKRLLNTMSSGDLQALSIKLSNAT